MSINRRTFLKTLGAGLVAVSTKTIIDMNPQGYRPGEAMAAGWLDSLEFTEQFLTEGWMMPRPVRLVQYVPGGLFYNEQVLMERMRSDLFKDLHFYNKGWMLEAPSGSAMNEVVHWKLTSDEEEEG